MKLLFLNRKILRKIGENYKLVALSFYILLGISVLLAATLVYAALIISKRQKSTERILSYDDLTGLLSERGFDREATRLLQAHPNTPYFILDMDIDNFTYYRNLYGFEQSDILLKSIAALIFDVMGPDEAAARIRYDHFVFLLAGESEKLRTELQVRFTQFLNNMSKKQVMVHFGAYQVVDREEPIQGMRMKAVAAKKQVKGKRTELIGLYNRQLFLKQRTEIELSGKFDAALKNGDFEVFFQPKYDSVSEFIAGAEALVRWRRSDGSLMMPDEFVPVFERNGLVTRLDFYVFEEVCRTMVAFQKSDIPLVPISVNFSRINLYNTAFAEKIIEIVQQYELDPSLIEIEITESAYFEHEELLEDVARVLHNAGFKMSIDDFGKGYSSLNLMKGNSFDVVKIDQAFLDHNAENVETSMVILKNILQLTRELKLETVAEGVESRAQVEFLRESGCHLIQGFCFSKPVPCNRFRELLMTAAAIA